MQKRLFKPASGKTIVDHLGRPLPEKGAKVPNLPYYHRLVRNGEGAFVEPKKPKSGGKSK